jgi:ribosomal protein L11 methyltransferase
MGVDWLEISVTAASEAVGIVAELFDRMVPGGGVIETPVDCFEYELSAVPPPDKAIVRGYLPLDGAAEELPQELERGLWLLQALYPISEPLVRHVAEDGWAQAWKEQYHLQRVGKRIVIVPAWEDYAPIAGEAVIRLEPGMAFGTGLHASTRLCLAALEACLVPDATVLDVGTGSGVLAIAAAKLGARSVLALDTDPVAVAVARENVANNGVASQVTVRHGSLPGGYVPRHFASGGELSLLHSGHFDLVLVNILAPVIVGLAPALAARLSPFANTAGEHRPVGSQEPAQMRRQGRLVAAGLIESQEQDVADALQAQGLRIIDRAHEQDWVALVAAWR